MSDRAFLDTNIFVHTYDNSDPVKKSIARELIRTSLLDRNAVVSYQVVQEFFNVVLKQNSIMMRPEDAQQLLETLFRPLLSVPSSIPLFDAAIHLQGRYRFSWYDSLIVSAAQQANCKILYTEDLQHGQRLGDLLIQNPFL
jgi:predicted nucleic acid-binding protein